MYRNRAKTSVNLVFALFTGFLVMENVIGRTLKITQLISVSNPAWRHLSTWHRVDYLAQA
ncbi:MAG: hypothetical protein P4L49_11835 [Desulfosporosinus sp.]|nr:hypothetical protein [Desulfosporosinus sp.]